MATPNTQSQSISKVMTVQTIRTSRKTQDKTAQTAKTSNGNKSDLEMKTHSINGEIGKMDKTVFSANVYQGNTSGISPTSIDYSVRDKLTTQSLTSSSHSAALTTQVPVSKSTATPTKQDSIGGNAQDANRTLLSNTINIKHTETSKSSNDIIGNIIIAGKMDSLPPKYTTESNIPKNPRETSASSILSRLKATGITSNPSFSKSLDLIQPPINIASTTLAMVGGVQSMPRKVSATTTTENLPVAISGNREGWEIPVLISLAILVVLLMVMLIVCCIVCKRRLRQARAMRSPPHSLKHTAGDDLAKARQAPQSSDIWPANSQDSSAHLQMDSGFGDQWFESDFNNTSPWAYENRLCRENHEEEMGVPDAKSSPNTVKMSTFRAWSAGSGADGQNLHPDYIYEHKKLKEQLQDEQRPIRTSYCSQERETGNCVKVDSPKNDPEDKLKYVYSAVAPKKSKRKTASTSSKQDIPRDMLMACKAEVIHNADFKRSQSDNNVGMQNLRKMSQSSQSNEYGARNLDRYRAHPNLEQISNEDAFLYSNEMEHDVTKRIGNGFDSVFGTSVTQIIGRKPRIDKCVSFDEAEGHRVVSTPVAYYGASEWSPLKYGVGKLEEDKAHSHNTFTRSTNKGSSESSESRKDCDIENGNETDRSKQYKSEAVPSTDEFALEVPIERSAFDVKEESNMDGSSPSLSDPSQGFSFLRKTKDRILANRQISKQRCTPNSFLPNENQTESSVKQRNDQVQKILTAKRMKPNETSDRKTDQSQHIHASIEDKKDVINFCGRAVPKIVINNETYSNVSSHKKDKRSNDIHSNILKSYDKPGPYKNTALFSLNGDCSDEAFAEKLRRFSAPTVHNCSPHILNISPAFQRRIFKSMSSDGLGGSDVRWGSKSYGILPENQRSWSDDFYDLIRRTDSRDPEKAEYFKRLINDRYETLFGNKDAESKLERLKSNVDGVNRRLGASENPSPRTVKRRSAATRQKRLSKDSSPIHSPYSSIDDGDSSLPTSPLFGTCGESGHLILPDPSQWKLLYDKVSTGSKISAFDKDWKRRRPSRRGLAEGTDGAEYSQTPSITTESQSSLKSNMGLDAEQLDKKNGSSDINVYSEIQSTKFDGTTLNTSSPNIPDSNEGSYLHNHKESVESISQEPIYESIPSIDRKKPQKKESLPSSVATELNIKALQRGIANPVGINDYAEIKDVKNSDLENSCKIFDTEKKANGTPQLPPLRPNQMPVFSNNKLLDHVEPGSLRQRSFTTSDISGDKAFPALANQAIPNKYNRPCVIKMGKRDRNIFQSNPQSSRKQKSLTKARRFSKDSDKVPGMTKNRKGFASSRTKEPVLCRSRAYSVPTLSAGDMMIDLDLTQFKSSASNLILEHSDNDEGSWFDETTVSKDSHAVFKEAENVNVPVCHSMNNSQKNSEKLRYFELNKSLLAGLQKSSV